MKKYISTKKGGAFGGTQSGFLLVELVVALFVFSIVMVVAIGSILSAFDANKKAQSLQSVMNNLNLAMEEMTKSLAVGKNYACGSDDPGDGVGDDCPLGSGGPFKKISFTSQDNQTITYEFTSAAGVCPTGCTTRRIGGVSATALRLTASEISIDTTDTTGSGFYVSGTSKFSANDAIQPRVFLVIKGTAQAGPRNSTSFALQTMVSQRIPDLNS